MKPEHYNQSIEPLDVIEQTATYYQSKHMFAIGNVIKYVMRAPLKNGVEDLEKAKHYLERVIKQLKEDERPWALEYVLQ